MMLYKLVATANGREVIRLVLADSTEAALAKFTEEWTQYGDAVPTGAYITESWSMS